jgi:hypothetical protein
MMFFIGGRSLINFSIEPIGARLATFRANACAVA